MVKKLSFILFCFPSLLAMSQVKKSAQRKIILKHGIEIDLPCYLAKLSDMIYETLDLIGDDASIPLPHLAEADWSHIHTRLALAYKFSTKKKEHYRQALFASLRKLSADDLLSCMKSADYLDVPVIFDACLELAYAGYLNSLSYEKLCQLPQSTVHEIIARRACAQCGPYEATELASCKRYKNKGYTGGAFFGIADISVARNGRIVFGPSNSLAAMSIWDPHSNQFCEGPEEFKVVSTFDDIIVVGCHDGTVRICDMQGNQLAVCEVDKWEGSIEAVCVTQDGKVVSGSSEGYLRIWDMQGNQLTVCEAHGRGMWESMYICIAPNGTIVSGGDDGQVKIWDTEGNQLAFFNNRLHREPVKAVCVASTNRIIYGHRDGGIHVWNTENGRGLYIEKHEESIEAVCTTKNGKIISGSKDGTVRIWSMIEGEQLAVCEGHKDGVTSMCVTEDNKIISGSDDGMMRIWDTEGNQLARWKGHNDCVWKVCVAPDGSVVSGSADGTVKVWDATVSFTDEKAEKVWSYLQNNATVEATEDGWGHIKNILLEEPSIKEGK